MKRTLLMSVAAFALAAGSTVALSQGSGSGGGGGAAGGGTGGAGGNTPMANPSAPSGGQDTVPTKRGAQDRTIPEKQKSTQQSPSGQSGTTTGQSQDNKTGQPSTTQQSQSPSTGGSKQGTAQRGTGGGSNVSLTTEQKTKIRQTVLTSSAPRVTRVDFDVRVGTVVPRTVRVAPLPATIIEIEPQWRGYMYFVYNDEIIVVEPGSLRIVAVLEV